MLSFDYAIPPDVKVNLYVRTGDEFHAVRLTGHKDSLFRARVIGDAAITADGKWHTAAVNLRDLFLREKPGAKHITIEDIFIGNMDGREYLTCGIGGNHAGTVYRLDNVRDYLSASRQR